MIDKETVTKALIKCGVEIQGRVLLNNEGKPTLIAMIFAKAIEAELNKERIRE